MTITVYRMKHTTRSAQRLPKPETVATVETLDDHDLDAMFGPVTAETEREQQRVIAGATCDWLTIITRN